MNLKIHSGGQEGADIAGLWVAKWFNIPTGGVAPAGYKTQLGNQIGLKTIFGLREMGDYRTRTIQNVRESDVTLIFSKSMNSPGTVLTRNSCTKFKKQCFAIEDLRYPGESLQAYWGNIKEDRGLVWLNCVNYLYDVVVKSKIVDIDENYIINVAGNSTKKTTPEAFEFAFVSFWHLLMTVAVKLEKDGIDFYGMTAYKDVDPCEIAITLKDKYDYQA